MFQFWKDEPTAFIGSVTINGSSGADSTVRLILDFGSRKILFNGTLEENRLVVNVPKLPDMHKDSGKVTVEVIVDRTYFEVFSDNFSLSMKKSVTLSDVRTESVEEIEVTLADINLEIRETPEEEIFKEGCSERDRARSKTFFEKLDEEIPEDFEPVDVVRTWADDVFNDTASREANVAMFELQKKLEK